MYATPLCYERLSSAITSVNFVIDNDLCITLNTDANAIRSRPRARAF